MGKATLTEARPTIESLVAQQEYSEAITLLGRIWPTLGSPEEWDVFLGLLEIMPHTQLLESIDAATLFAKALKWLKQYERLIEWSARVVKRHGVAQAAPVQSEWASGLIVMQKYDQARSLLDKALPYLVGEALGVAWSRLGYALFNLGKSVEAWQGAYASARPFLSGEELGRALLNEAFCLAEAGMSAESRKVYLEALGCFRNNPYFQTYVRYNLGISALRDLEPEAERHFLEAVTLTRNPKAAELRAPVFNGLAASRRALGEWARAESAYKEALQNTTYIYDHHQAILGLARTQRLSGRAIEALETVELALQDQAIERPMLYLARSMAFLSLEEPTQAAQALAAAGEIKAESDRWLWRIAKAELARQQGQPEEAVTLLEGLPLHTLHAREEVRQWPKLFELLQQAGREVPIPLEYPLQTTVEVKALGLLKVSINGRPIQLAPISLTGELLVFLLEHKGQASSEQIIAALWPEYSFAEKRKTLSGLVVELRHILGWPASIQSLRQAYQLDPSVGWVYDVAQARKDKKVELNFMEGNYKEWVLEVNEGLEEYR